MKISGNVAAWVAIIVTVFMAMLSAYLSLERAVTYHKAINEAQEEKLQYFVDRQQLTEKQMAQNSMIVGNHELRLTNVESDLRELRVEVRKIDDE